MPRRKEAPGPPPVPHVLQPNAVYTVASASACLGVPRSGIKREVRMRRLVPCKRAGKYYFLGEDLLAWLRSGKVQPEDAATDAA